MTTAHIRDIADAEDLLDPGQPFSRVDRFSRFEGRYEAMQNLLIEGSCSGEIDCRGMLVIASGATVTARVTARDIRVAGVVDGDLECSGRFELLPSGRASGMVKARQIVVHEGAQYDGELQMTGSASFDDLPEAEEWQPDMNIDESASARPSAARDEALPEAEDEALPAAEPAEVPDFLRPRRSE